MSREIHVLDNYSRRIDTAWWLYLLLGLSLILLAVMIFIMPELLAYLVAGFLLFDGLVLVVIGLQLRRLGGLLKRWREEGSPSDGEPRRGTEQVSARL